MARTILVVDDEPTLREALVDALEADGFRVVAAADGREALTRFRAERPDLVLLDLMLPELSGIEVCRIIRAESGVPIVMLTAKDFGARQGRRARARRRRLRHQAVQPARADGPDPGPVPPLGPGGRGRRPAGRRRSRARSRPTSAATGCCATARSSRSSRRRSSCWRSCIRHPGQVFTRDQLLEHVWGYDYGGETRTVDVHVHWLRSRIEADPADPAFIHTVRGVGLRVPPPDLRRACRRAASSPCGTSAPSPRRRPRRRRSCPRGSCTGRAT